MIIKKEITIMTKNPKNFFTRFLSLKKVNDLIRMTDYITDRNDEHINHSRDDHKTIVFDSQKKVDSKLINIISIANYHSTKIKLNRKGGRPSSPATSIVISIPEQFGDNFISLLNLKLLHRLLITDIIKKFNEIYKLNWTQSEQKEFIDMYVISSIHFKKNNPHINIILPSIVETFKTVNKDNKQVRTKNKVVKLRLGLKQFSYQTKLLVEKNMSKIGYSLSSYIIKKVRKNKKSNPIASLKQDIKIEKSQQEKITQTLQNELNSLQDNLIEIRELFDSMEFLKESSEKLQKRISIYLKRMDTAFFEKDIQKFEKNEKLVNKSYNKLVELVDKENKEKLKKFEDLKQKIKSKKQLLNSLHPAPSL